MLAQCHRIAARIALADGDLARARSSLDLAAKLRHTRFGQAELAVLEAAWARASGKPYLDAAREAHAQAQTVDDPESLREAHTLLHHAYLAERDRDAAQSHLLRAVAERDRVADSLPAGLRERFLSRPSLSELAALEGTIERDGEREEVLPEPPMPRSRRGDNAARELVGQSTAMRSLRTAVKRVAATEATVLVTGETGTGKELVAEAIHRHSQRARGPLVKVNCAAVGETRL